MSKGHPSASQTVYIGIGSNIGERLANCRQAIRRMDHIEGCRVGQTSRFYETEPVGAALQDWYVNGVIRMETTLDPYDLLSSLMSIESVMGRIRRQKWEPRIIDLDILLYGDSIIEGDSLTIPHPLMHQRRFVLQPMAELDPGRIHPVLRKSMADLLEDLGVEGQTVTRLSDA